jgi:hypothetical protein
MNKSTEVRLFGGMGNQLFQLMAGILASEIRNSNLTLDTRWLKIGFEHSNSNIFAFNWKNIPNYSVKEGSMHKTEKLLSHLFNSLSVRDLIPAKCMRYRSDKQFFESTDWYNASRINLIGYFQDIRIFKLLNEKYNFTFELEHISQEYKKQLVKLDGNFISIHIRGGDYITSNNYHLILQSDYYQKAIRLVRLRHHDLPIVVFTDDEKHSSTVLRGIDTKIDQIFSNSLSPVESMKLMSKAKVIITANSTFSLWSGLIAKNCELTITPRIWYTKSTLEVENLLPSNWVKI